MNMIDKFKLYFNTVKYMKTIQIVYQLKNRLMIKEVSQDVPYSTYVSYHNIDILLPLLDFEENYIKRFRIEDIMNNNITLLNQQQHISLVNWNIQEASHLWNFNLHYMEYLIPLSKEYKDTGNIIYYEKWKELLNSWNDYAGLTSEDAYHPYTISLRIVNILISMSSFKELLNSSDIEFFNTIKKAIFIQYRILEKKQEKNLLANHYFENLKTLVICSLIYEENNKFSLYYEKLTHQLNEQILQDGVHYELSCMYHKIILEDLLRIYTVLQQMGKHDEQSRIKKSILNMNSAIYSLEYGMGKTPLFNDAADCIAKDTVCLINFIHTIFHVIPEHISSFDNAGYYKIYSDNIAIMVDGGGLGPSYMSGHAHGDALSLEISKAGKPIFVNSGTYQYQGKLRKFFRSSQAHNTLLINKQQQSELWGEHRAARRIRNVNAKMIGSKFIGEYTSYTGNKHKRMIFPAPDRQIIIEDEIWASVKDSVQIFFHIEPHYHAVMGNSCILIKNQEDIWVASIFYQDGADVIIHKNDDYCWYASEFGILQQKDVIELNYKLVNCNQQFQTRIEL